MLKLQCVKFTIYLHHAELFKKLDIGRNNLHNIIKT